MIARSFRTTLVFATLALAFAAGPARADSIDGNWCMADGRRMHIEGPQIVTPGGARMAGNYDRHGFDYVVPAREPGAGGTVRMVLRSDEEVQVTTEKPQAKTEIWHRCGPPVS